jgi:hypothetical protein
MRDDGDARRVRRGDERRARVGERGQPGFGQRPRSWPARAGARRASTSPSRAAASRPFGGRGSSTIAISCNGRASGQTASTRFRNARSSSRSRRPSGRARGDADHAARQQLVERGGAPGAPKSSVFGTRCSAPGVVIARCGGRAGVGARPASGSMPARRSSALVRISGRPISAVGSSDSIASSRAMPSVSALALPAQSYGCSVRR